MRKTSLFFYYLELVTKIVKKIAAFYESECSLLVSPPTPNPHYSKMNCEVL
jgi:hypothetical protein